jgi:hypothetical protein
MAGLSAKLYEALCGESDDAWRLLTKRLTYYVASLLGGRIWRGFSEGVAPDGYDPGSIAAEAITQLFAGSGWEPKGNPYEQKELWFELARLARNIVRNLERRKENAIAINEHCLTHGEVEVEEESFFNNFSTYGPQPDTEAQLKEANSRLKKFQGEFDAALGADDELKQLFKCICEGWLKREEQADRLKVTVKQVTNARKRLDRRLEKFAADHPCYPRTFIWEIKNA